MNFSHAVRFQKPRANCGGCRVSLLGTSERQVLISTSFCAQMAPACFADCGIAKTHLSHLKVTSRDLFEANEQPPPQFHLQIFSQSTFQCFGIFLRFQVMLVLLCSTESIFTSSTSCSSLILFGVKVHSALLLCHIREYFTM